MKGYLNNKPLKKISVCSIVVFFILSAPASQAQSKEIDRLVAGELRMTFPSIYFKHRSADYAAMPYSVDSCLKYIATNFDKSINSLVMWRDSAETDALTNKRIRKLDVGLQKYIQDKHVKIQNMGDAQKISRYTTYTAHIYHPKIWCGNCWKNGFHMDKKSRTLRQVARRSKKAELKNSDN